MDKQDRRPAVEECNGAGCRRRISLRRNRQRSGAVPRGAAAMIRGLLAALFAFTGCAMADSGVLIPGDRQEPDPAVFSLNELALDIRIDNGMARVQIRQIFANHSSTVQEGVYHFALPSRATVSDFAVWEDVTRIPGVILERRHAGEIYSQAKARAIDPGL